MPYISVVNTLWVKLLSEGSARRPTTSRQTFENVCHTFYQAENCPESAPASRDLKTYRAEYNIWAYYFGEDGKFPGGDLVEDDNERTSRENPAISFECQFVTPLAALIRQQLESIWASRRCQVGYQPQLGWNPVSGEPWMALRSYATNSFPALVGQSHTVLNAFQDMNPDFIIQYERFPEQKFTLIWPEFADPKKLMNQETWEKFAVLRAFLKYWAGEDNSAPLIDTAYLKWLDLPEVYRKPLPLPMGFVLDRSRAASLPAPFNAAKKLARKSGDARAAAGITRGRRPRRDSHRPSRG